MDSVYRYMNNSGVMKKVTNMPDMVGAWILP